MCHGSEIEGYPSFAARHRTAKAVARATDTITISGSTSDLSHTFHDFCCVNRNT